MKNIKILIVLLFFAGCKAQNLSSLDGYDAPNTSYFSDLEGELNRFVGTWKFTNGNTTFIVTLQKKVMVPTPNGHFEDLLVGEYSYSVNGNVLVNTMAELSNPAVVGRYHNISGRLFKPVELIRDCGDCLPTERILELDFSDPERKYLNTACIVRFILDSNPSQIKFTVYDTHMVMLPEVDSPTAPRVPYGDYILTK